MLIHLNSHCLFNLNLTLCCGQAFRWNESDGWWHGVVQKNLIKIRQDKNTLLFEGAGEDFLLNYLGLNDDLQKIYRDINKDRYIEATMNEFKGLRILRQDPWECLISYICATFKNISSIKRMLNHLSKRFGEEHTVRNERFFAFPSPTKLARASLIELRECELGYRAKYLSQTSKKIAEKDFDLDSLKKASHDEAKKLLLELPGVGQKVADCILLFGFGKLDAFPVDVWVTRALLRHYSSHFPSNFITKIARKDSLNNSQYKQLNVFGREYFGKYAGYAQEYLYHYERIGLKQR